MAFLFRKFHTSKNQYKMISKKVANVQEALKGVSDNMTFMFGGFGLIRNCQKMPLQN